MSMSKHDYDRLADAMFEAKPSNGDSDDAHWQWDNTCVIIAEALEANNDNFDRAVFLAKCGIKI